MTTETPDLPQVVGTNVRRFREKHKLSQEDVAIVMREHGFKWSGSRVGELENGRFGLSAAAFIGLAQALSELCETPVFLADLAVGDAGIALTDAHTVRNSSIRSALAGNPVDLGDSDLVRRADIEDDGHEFAIRSLAQSFHDHERLGTSPLKPGRAAELKASADALANRRAARALNLPPEDAEALAQSLWGSTFAAQRDSLAGADASAQKRGRVSRLLLDELASALSSSQGPTARQKKGAEHGDD